MNAISYLKKAATFSLRAIKSNLRVVADRNVVSIDSISSGACKRCRLTNLVMIFLLIWSLIVLRLEVG